MTGSEDDWLEDDFALLRDEDTRPDAALMGRIMADAEE